MRGAANFILSILTPALLSLTAPALLSSCSNDECLENKNARPQAELRNYLEPEQTVTLDSILVYAVGAPTKPSSSGAPSPSAIVDSTASFSNFYLPFDLESDTTRVVFRYMQKSLRQYDLRDTLTIIYSRLPYFVSPACGASYRFLIQETTHTRILLDSVAIPAPTVTNIPETNLQLFFPVLTAESQQSSEVPAPLQRGRNNLTEGVKR